MASPATGARSYARRAQYGAFTATLIAVAGMVMGAALAIFAVVDPPGFASLRLMASELVAPIDRLGASASATVESSGDVVANWWNAGEQNRELKAELAVAQSRVARADGLIVENHQLRALLGLTQAGVRPVAVTRILTTTPTSTQRYAIIDAGRNRGVETGQPVRAVAGLIGRTLEVGPSVARVLLITDRRSVVPARRASDGLPLIASGRGDRLLDVRTLGTATISLRPGDIILASGSGGLFQPRTPLARVIRVTRDGALALPLAEPDGAVAVIVEPAADIDASELPEPAADANQAAPSRRGAASTTDAGSDAP